MHPNQLNYARPNFGSSKAGQCPTEGVIEAQGDFSSVIPNIDHRQGSIYAAQQHLSVINHHLQKLMSNTAGGAKTPLALLNEFCTTISGGIKEEVLNQGAAHDPKYECRLQVRLRDQLIEASGIGKTKKDAKQAAAKAVLLKLGFLESRMAYSPSAQAPPEVQPKQYDPDVEGNPVGDLNTLCMKIRFPAPVYKDLSHEHNTSGHFKFSCQLDTTVIDYGIGPTKKHAKRVAASKVLQKLCQVMQEPETAHTLFSDSAEDDLCRKLAAFSILSVKPVVPVSPPAIKTVDVTDSTLQLKPLTDIMKWLHSLKGDKIEKLMALKTSELQEGDHVVILNDVASEQHLRILYQDFPPYLDDLDYKSVLSLVVGGTRHVFIGTGQNPLAARKPAAFQALEYIRLAARCNVFE